MRHQYATPWIWFFLLPLAFDYKATDANTGHFAQFIFVLPAIAAGIALLLIAPRFHERSRLRSVVTWSLILCVFGSIVAQLVQDNDTGNYLRTLLPFLSSCWVISWRAARGANSASPSSKKPCSSPTSSASCSPWSTAWRRAAVSTTCASVSSP